VLRVEQVRDRARRALVVRRHRRPHTSGPAPELAAATSPAAAPRASSSTARAGPVRLGLAQELGVALGGTALRLEELSADALTRVVKAVA
jgi:magnesium chelatase subunit D